MDAYSERVINTDFHSILTSISHPQHVTASIVEPAGPEDDLQSVSSARDVDFDNILDVTGDDLTFDFGPDLRAVLSTLHSVSSSDTGTAPQQSVPSAAPAAPTTRMASSPSSGAPAAALRHSKIQHQQPHAPRAVRAVSTIRPASVQAVHETALAAPKAPPVPSTLPARAIRAVDQSNNTQDRTDVSRSSSSERSPLHHVTPRDEVRADEPVLVPIPRPEGTQRGSAPAAASAVNADTVQPQLTVPSRKTALVIPCALWAQGRGTCVFGDACAFAHGQVDGEGVQGNMVQLKDRPAMAQDTVIPHAVQPPAAPASQSSVCPPSSSGPQTTSLSTVERDMGAANEEVDRLRSDVTNALSGLASEKTRFLSVVGELEGALRVAQAGRAAAEGSCARERATSAAAADAARRASEAAAAALQALAASRAEGIELHRRLELLQGEQAKASKAHAAQAQRLKTIEAARVKAVAALDRARADIESYREQLHVAKADLQTVQRSSAAAIAAAQDGARAALRDMAVLREESQRIQKELLSKDQALEDAARTEAELRAALGQQRDSFVSMQRQASAEIAQVRRDAQAVVDRAHADRDSAREVEREAKIELARLSAALESSGRILQQSVSQVEAVRQEASRAHARAEESDARAALAHAQMLHARQEAQAATDAMLRLREEVLSLQAGMSAGVLSLQAVTARARDDVRSHASYDSAAGIAAAEMVQPPLSTSPVQHPSPRPRRMPTPTRLPSPTRSHPQAADETADTTAYLEAFSTPKGSTERHHDSSVDVDASRIEPSKQSLSGGSGYANVSVVENGARMAGQGKSEGMQDGSGMVLYTQLSTTVGMQSQAAVPPAVPSSVSTSKPDKGRRPAPPPVDATGPGQAPSLDAEGVADEERPQGSGSHHKRVSIPAAVALMKAPVPHSPDRDAHAQLDPPAYAQRVPAIFPTGAASSRPVPRVSASPSPRRRDVLVSPPSVSSDSPVVGPSSSPAGDGADASIVGNGVQRQYHSPAHMQVTFASVRAQTEGDRPGHDSLRTPSKGPGVVSVDSALFVSPPSPSRAFKPVHNGVKERREGMENRRESHIQAGTIDEALQANIVGEDASTQVPSSQPSASTPLPVLARALAVLGDSPTTPPAARGGSPDIPPSTESDQQPNADGLDLSVVLEATGAEFMDMLNSGVQGLWSTLIRADSRGTPDEERADMRSSSSYS